MRSDTPTPKTILARVTCPACGHFAAFKLDAAGEITYGEATSYRCPLTACDTPFGGER